MSRPETPPAEENGVANGGLSDGEPPSIAAVVDEKISKAKKKVAAINSGAASAAKAALSSPKARSFGGKGRKGGVSATLRQYSKLAQATFEEYPLYVSVGGAVAIAVGVVCPVLFYAFK